MLRKLGKRITNNFGLKILAALFAVVLWIVVVNIDDPVIPKPYTTSVLPINVDYITSQGKYFEWLDGNNTISFTASASRSIIEKLSSSDFSATADMEKIEYDEKSGSYQVPVSISVSKNSSEVTISSKQLYLDVVLEDLGTCQKAITANTKGNVADGCAVGALKIVGSNLLKVSGPYSIVSQIDTAVATINVDGMSEDVTDSVVPVLYDADGNAIDTTKLTLSLNTVTISAQILKTKDVALEFSTMGEVAEGYMMTGTEYSLETVRIKGEAATLNTVNKITIPADVLDVTDLTEDLETTVDISSYLPSGTSLVLNSDAAVEVRIKVEPLVTKVISVPVTKLTVQDIREGYMVEFAADTFEVEVAGAESAVADVTAENILGYVSAGGLGSGEHQLEPVLELDGEQRWIATAEKIPVTISESDEESGGVSDAENAGGADTASDANGNNSAGSNTGAGANGTAGSNTGTTNGAAGGDTNTNGTIGGNTDSAAGGNTTNTSTENTEDSGNTGNSEKTGAVQSGTTP